MLPRLATSLARLFKKVCLYAGAKNANFGFLRIRPKTLPAGLFLTFFPQIANEQQPFPQKPTQNPNSAWRKHRLFSKNTKCKIRNSEGTEKCGR
jgi:hypothetical protein